MVVTGNEYVKLSQLKMLSDNLESGGEQGSVQVSYRGNSDANFYFVDAEGHLPKFEKSLFYSRFSTCNNRDLC